MYLVRHKPTNTQAKATTSTRRGPLLSDESSRYARKEENSYHSSCSLLRAWNNITHTHKFFLFFFWGVFLEKTLEKLSSTKLLLTTVSTYKSKKNSCVFVVCVCSTCNHLERNKRNIWNRLIEPEKESCLPYPVNNNKKLGLPTHVHIRETFFSFFDLAISSHQHLFNWFPFRMCVCVCKEQTRRLFKCCFLFFVFFFSFVSF